MRGNLKLNIYIHGHDLKLKEKQVNKQIKTYMQIQTWDKEDTWEIHKYITK